MGNKEKHLEFIQGIINRMASNSFALKGWAVTLVAGIFALASRDSEKLFFLVAYIPILIFWGLDAYYLSQERRYRDLYNKVRFMDDNNVDYSLDVSAKEFKTEKNKWFFCVRSRTIIWFYAPLALLTTGIIVLTTLF